MKRVNRNNFVADFCSYLRLERSLAANTISSYSSDIEKFIDYLEREDSGANSGVEYVTSEIISKYLSKNLESGISKRSQARLISSLKAFYKYLEMESLVSKNPTELTDAPKIKPYLPVVMSVAEVENIINSVDLSIEEGHRNKAIFEVLYSCGLRVTELVNLKISDLFTKELFIRVIGKGSKQRLVPIGEPAVEALSLYFEKRKHIKVKKGC
ncbi:MAG TPA: tyrosine recombinase XerD, partial [Rikenellaceae bacterium]|nr:tyrosine recombinase XerD [Rikenellaceae bacterium]